MNPEFLQNLSTNDFAVVKNFLNQKELLTVTSEVDRLYSEGRFKKAGISKTAEVRHEIRNDEVLWLEPNEPTEPQKILWNKLGDVKTSLNQNLMFGLWDFEGHYAVYQEGSFYKRHVDSFRFDDARLLSFVLYLNENWQTNDGGELHLYHDKEIFEIQPIGGTLVCFLSNKVEHEVLTARKQRKSFTGWFKKRQL